MKNYALFLSAICMAGLAACAGVPSQAKKSVTTTVVTAPADTCVSCYTGQSNAPAPAAPAPTAANMAMPSAPAAAPVYAPAPTPVAPVAMAAQAPAPMAAVTSVANTVPANPLCTAPGSVRVSAVGYGSTSAVSGLTPGQKKLLGMRASKMDAYRSMAEQVAGVRVTGNTTVADMMAKNDGLRIAVDAYVRGARVVTVTPMSDGNYETILEVELDTQFSSVACQTPGLTSQGPAVIRAAETLGSNSSRYASSGGFYYGD